MKRSGKVGLSGAAALCVAGGLFVLALLPVVWLGHGWLGVMQTEKLIFAAAEGDVSTVRRALSLGARTDGRTSSGRTALEMALVNRENALDRRIEIVRILLDAGADPNQPISTGDPPLLATTEPPLLRLLKASGAKFARRTFRSR